MSRRDQITAAPPLVRYIVPTPIIGQLLDAADLPSREISTLLKISIMGVTRWRLGDRKPDPVTAWLLFLLIGTRIFETKEFYADPEAESFLRDWAIKHQVHLLPTWREALQKHLALCDSLFLEFQSELVSRSKPNDFRRALGEALKLRLIGQEAHDRLVPCVDGNPDTRIIATLEIARDDRVPSVFRDKLRTLLKGHGVEVLPSQQEIKETKKKSKSKKVKTL